MASVLLYHNGTLLKPANNGSDTNGTKDIPDDSDSFSNHIYVLEVH